ncbi:retrovirus-related pol polyprotein from transposon TNT 1-94 [Tanacetum coccineum]
MVACFSVLNHDLCLFLDFINNVNARAKSRSVKKNSKRKVGNPTGLRMLQAYERRSLLTLLTQLISKFLGTVKFGNDHVAKIMGYGDYQIRNVTISRVYYVEGLGHNLFSMGQFCGSNSSTFRQHTMLHSQSRKLFNHLARHGLVRGLPKLKFEKDHLCSACALGKSTKKPHKPKSEDTNQEKLYLLHMDLYGPMRVASVNGKKYILVIVDDYSRFTWVKCLRSKDEAPAFIINFLKMIQTLREYYEKVGISHETSVARSPQQNDVVKRQNCTLIEAARTKLIYAKAHLFLWAKAVATACYTQNRSMIRRRHGKTPYELLHNKPPDLSYLHVFGALCYPKNNSENLGKLQPKADIDIFIGYAPTKKAFWIYNRHTRRIVETIHVDIDELTAMASEHSSLGPALHEMTPATISSGLVPNPYPLTPFVPPSRTDWDLLFQPLFDEFLNPSPSVDHPVPEVVAPINEVIALVLADSTSSPSLTTVDQDAPSPIAHTGNDPYFGVPILEIPSDQSSSSDSIHTIDSSIALTAFADADLAGCQIHAVAKRGISKQIDIRFTLSRSMLRMGIKFLIKQAGNASFYDGDSETNWPDDVDGIVVDSNSVFILKASIPPKRKLDLSTGIYFSGIPGYGNFMGTLQRLVGLLCITNPSIPNIPISKVKATLKSAWTEKDQIDNLLKERRLMRSLEKFVGGKLYEGDLRLRQKNHMILSYDVLINQFDESNANVLERFYTSAGNPVKEILLKLNLPDHRILKDGGEEGAAGRGALRIIVTCGLFRGFLMVVLSSVFCVSGNNGHLDVFLGFVDSATSFIACETLVSMLGVAVLAKLLVISTGVVGRDVVAVVVHKCILQVQIAEDVS